MYYIFMEIRIIISNDISNITIRKGIVLKIYWELKKYAFFLDFLGQRYLTE